MNSKATNYTSKTMNKIINFFKRLFRRATAQKTSHKDSNWNAKAKKHSLISVTRGKAVAKVPAMMWIKDMALALPPMKRDGVRVVHFREMKRLYMNGKSKRESVEKVQAYVQMVKDAYLDAYKKQSK